MKRAAVIAASVALLAASAVHAQKYPERPVRAVVPFPAGGGTDILARLLLQKMSERMAATFVIDNRAGAGGTIGTEIVAKAPPDGYTLLVASSSHTINPSVYKKLGYKGNVPAFVDLISGAVSLSFPTITSGLPPVRSGKLRALGVTSRARSSVVPDVPTIAESGLPGYEATTWYGMLAPASTSPAVVGRLQREMVEVIGLPDVRDKLLAQGLEPVGNRPPEFAEIITAELVKWRKVVAAAGVKAE